MRNITIPLLIQITLRDWLGTVEDQRKRTSKIAFFSSCFSSPGKTHHSSCSRYLGCHLHTDPAVPRWAVYSLRALFPFKEDSFWPVPLHLLHLWALKNLFHGPHGYWKSSANTEKQNSCFVNSLTEQVHARALCGSASWAQHPWERAPLLSPLLDKALTWSGVLVALSLTVSSLNRRETKANISYWWGFCTMRQKYFIAVIKTPEVESHWCPNAYLVNLISFSS